MADPSTNTEMVRVPILGEDGRISNDYVPQEIPDSVEAVTQKAAEAAQSASDARAAATAAGESAEAASTSETNAAESAKDASDAATTATQQATAAKGHADTAKSYSDSASQSALSASGSVTAAAKSAGDAATSATAADASASNAATSASNAATSESNAATSASDAAGSASDASGYATNASDAASAAADSASAALNSKNQAQQILDEANAKFIDSATATTLAPSAPATATVVDNVLQLGIPKGDTGTGIPDGGSAGQVVKKTTDGTEWAYDTGAVYNSEEGLQEMSEDGTNDPIYNFGITQGGMSASMSVMGDSPEVAVDYSSSSTSYRNAIGADADGPYVDLNLSGEPDGATKYRYIDDVNSMPDTDGIPTAKAAYAAAKGNTLSGTKSGAIASVDDAYPSKPRRLTVYGATRQNLWVNPSGTMNGVTCTANADGSVTLEGTSTSSTNISVSLIYLLKPNTQYTVSCNAKVGATGGKSCFTIAQYTPDNSILNYIDFAYSDNTQPTTRTFTTASNMGFCQFWLFCTVNTTVSGTYRVMLNEGSTAQPWCPPGLNSVDELSVVTSGKNLADSGTSDSVNFQLVSSSLPPGTYTLNAVTAKSFRVNIVKGTGMTGNKITYGEPLPATFTLDDASPIFVNGYGTSASITDIQLELGSTATAYEPPTVTTTPIDLDGHTLNSLPDGTCDELTIDATGAVTLVQRVCAVEYEASDFNYSGRKYTEAGLPKPYAGGIDFSRNRQLSDFAPIGNADEAPGYPVIAVYTQGSRTALRSGTGNAEASASAQDTAFKAMLGSQTWHHLYKLATPETIELPPVTLPTLPAPTVNVFADAESSGTGYAIGADVELEYERDVNIAFEKLEAEVAALTVANATN